MKDLDCCRKKQRHKSVKVTKAKRKQNRKKERKKHKYSQGNRLLKTLRTPSLKINVSWRFLLSFGIKKKFKKIILKKVHNSCLLLATQTLAGLVSSLVLQIACCTGPVPYDWEGQFVSNNMSSAVVTWIKDFDWLFVAEVWVYLFPGRLLVGWDKWRIRSKRTVCSSGDETARSELNVTQTN